MKEIRIPRESEENLLSELKKRDDTESARMLRYLSMPDLSRTEGSPIYEIVERVKNIPLFKDFDIITIPEVVPADISFDLFDFAKDHPARSP